MATIEVLLLAFFLIFLVLAIVKMDRSYRERQAERMKEASNDLDKIIAERQKGVSK